MPDDFDDADFAALRPERTARFPLFELHVPIGNPQHVVLLVKHAGESNPSWMAAQRNAKFRHLSEEESDRAFDAIAAKHIIVGWEGVLERDGKTPKPYNPTAGLALLTKLREVKRSGLVGRLTMFVSDASNFTASTVDPVDLGNG